MISFFEADIQYRLPQKNAIRLWLLDCAKREVQTVDSLNYIFCSDRYLIRINKDYLNHNTFTDIITFGLSKQNKPIEGEIYISIDRVRENAKGLRISMGNELRRIVVHGLMHLCGYNDKSKKEKMLMTEKEDYYLDLWEKKFNVPRGRGK